MALGIVFDNPNKTYTSGQIVTGKVIRTFSTEQNVKGLEVQFTGVVHYRWERPVFCHNFYAFGDGRTVINILPGCHEYPFQFKLPQGLPSSFIGSFGSVKYEVKASMKMARGFDDKVKTDILVNAILDLNIKTGASQPANVRKAKTIGFASGKVAAVLKTPKIGFVPGECIPIEAEVQNNSSRNINAVRFNFMQTCICHEQTMKSAEANKETKLLVTVMRPGVERGNSKTMEEDILRVPVVPPTGLGNCRIIHVQYSLQMEVEIDGPSKNLKLSTPIIIGTIPIGPSFVDMVPSNPAFNPSCTSASAATAPRVMSYGDQAPPSYSEAMAGALAKS